MKEGERNENAQMHRGKGYMKRTHFSLSAEWLTRKRVTDNKDKTAQLIITHLTVDGSQIYEE